jgi:hypothetical protein
MLSYWLPAIEPAWLSALFALGFALAGGIAYFAASARRVQEPDAMTAAVLYAVGFGTLALSELLFMAETAWGWSLATLFGITGGAATAIAIIVTVVAVLAILAAAIIEVREEQAYRAQHANALLS